MKVKLFRCTILIFLVFLSTSYSSAQKNEFAIKLGGHIATTTDHLHTFGTGPYTIDYLNGRDLAPDFGIMYRYNGGKRWSLEIEGMYSNFLLRYNVIKESINIGASAYDFGLNEAKTIQIPIRYKYFVRQGFSVFAGAGAQIFLAVEMEDRTIGNEPELSSLLNNAKNLIDGTVPFIEIGAGLEVTSRISVDAKYVIVLGSIINNLEFQNTSIQPNVKLRGAFVNISYRFLKI